MECLSVCQAAFLSFSFCSFSVTVYQFVNMQCWYYNPAYWDHRLKLECKWYQSLVVALVLLWLDYGNATLAGLPACLLNRLQSVLNAAARSIAGLRSSSLGAHYRCSRQFSLAPRTRAHQVQTGGHCLPGSSRHCTSVLSDRLQYVADLPTRRRSLLRSSTSILVDIRPSRRVTVGDRSFAAAGPRLWNSLPDDVQSAPSVTTFRQKLKTHLFRQSYPDIV